MVLNLRVFLHQLLAMLLYVIKLTVVSLRMSMFRTVDKSTFAWDLHQTNFLLAIPTFIQVSLSLYIRSASYNRELLYYYRSHEPISTRTIISTTLHNFTYLNFLFWFFGCCTLNLDFGLLLVGSRCCINLCLYNLYWWC